MTTESAGERLTREHRGLDDLFGRFLAAAGAADSATALEAIRDFDEKLRRHTAEEEADVLSTPNGHRLAPPEGEKAVERLHRELRLEHVQIREVSAMIRRLLEERNDLEGARRLAPNLARRWEAHTAREERELYLSSP
jgi:hypothetical protein